MRRVLHVDDAHLEYDLGNLCVFDPSPLDESQLRADPDGTCAEVATRAAQSLLTRIFSLPTSAAPIGRLAQLPPPNTPIPRQKPLPKPRAPTKWEKFAQQKGIVKHKRSKLVFDEQQKEWRRRHGYKKANDAADIPIIEAKDGDEVQHTLQICRGLVCQLMCSSRESNRLTALFDAISSSRSDVRSQTLTSTFYSAQVGQDPFSQQKAQKAKVIKEQEKRQVANLKVSAKQGAHPATLRLAAALPEKGRGRPAKRKELAGDVRPPHAFAQMWSIGCLRSCAACTGHLTDPAWLELHSRLMHPRLFVRS